MLKTHNSAYFFVAIVCDTCLFTERNVNLDGGVASASYVEGPRYANKDSGAASASYVEGPRYANKDTAVAPIQCFHCKA